MSPSVFRCSVRYSPPALRPLVVQDNRKQTADISWSLWLSMVMKLRNLLQVINAKNSQEP